MNLNLFREQRKVLRLSNARQQEALEQQIAAERAQLRARNAAHALAQAEREEALEAATTKASDPAAKPSLVEIHRRRSQAARRG